MRRLSEKKKIILLQEILNALQTTVEFINYEKPERFFPYLTRAERIVSILERGKISFEHDAKEIQSLLKEISSCQKIISEKLGTLHQSAKDELNEFYFRKAWLKHRKKNSE
ncbi:MAG: hypothetical protein SFU98_09975 [Leptospiraceae bacterium]|nr:hypothetical protein [Leptospiraceae bacterium]